MRVCSPVAHGVGEDNQCVSPCTEQGFVILPSDFLSFSPVGTVKWKRQLHSSQLIGEKGGKKVTKRKL